MKKTVTPAKKERSLKKIIQKINHNSNRNNSITDSMRKLVLQWLIELSHTFTPLLSKQTLFLTIWIFDQVLSKYSDINPKNLQLLAVTCLQLSAKYEEVYPPRMMQLIQHTSNAYSKKQMVDLQEKILIALQFQITKPTRYTFFTLTTHSSTHLTENYSKTIEHSRYHNQKRYFDFITFLLELSLLKNWKGYTEKQISDGVILLANKVMKVRNTHLCQDDQENWGYEERIKEIGFQMVKVWKQYQNSVISQHYDCDKLSFVGGLKIIF